MLFVQGRDGFIPLCVADLHGLGCHFMASLASPIRLKRSGSVFANANARDTRVLQTASCHAFAKIRRGPESAKQPERDTREEMGGGRVHLY